MNSNGVATTITSPNVEAAAPAVDDEARHGSVEHVIVLDGFACTQLIYAVAV